MYRLLICALLFMACGAEDTPPPPPPAAQTTDPATQAMAEEKAAQVTFARQRIDRVNTMYLEGRLRCDTLPYDCKTMAGRVVLCYLGDDLLRGEALTGRTAAPDAYREAYFFDGEELYATVLQPAGGPSPTVRYYYNGNLLEQTGPEAQPTYGPEALQATVRSGQAKCPD